MSTCDHEPSGCSSFSDVGNWLLTPRVEQSIDLLLSGFPSDFEALLTQLSEESVISPSRERRKHSEKVGCERKDINLEKYCNLCYHR